MSLHGEKLLIVAMSPGPAQRFLNIYSAAYSIFYHQRHLLKRPMLQELRTASFDDWKSASVTA